MLVVKQIFSGVSILVITAVSTIFIADHFEVMANTEHRKSSKEGEILNMLIEIRTNQEHLLKKYENDILNK